MGGGGGGVEDGSSHGSVRLIGSTKGESDRGSFKGLKNIQVRHRLKVIGG